MTSTGDTAQYIADLEQEIAALAAQLAEIRCELRKYDARDLPLTNVEMIRGLGAKLTEAQSQRDAVVKVNDSIASRFEIAARADRDEIDRLRAWLEETEAELYDHDESRQLAVEGRVQAEARLAKVMEAASQAQTYLDYPGFGPGAPSGPLFKIRENLRAALAAAQDASPEPEVKP
jgi:hypothetical protein